EQHRARDGARRDRDHQHRHGALPLGFMRLPRNHKIFRGQLDVAPFAAVFFLLVIFLVFHSGLVLTPGVSLKLPTASGLPGLTNQAVVVAVAANGTCFYENQMTSENELKTKLRS